MDFLVKMREYFNQTGSIARFAGNFFTIGMKPRYEIKELLAQCYFIGYNSLPLVGLTGFIMGLVLTMQLRPSMVVYGVASQLPIMVGVAIIREIGPVITGLIFAGKIGSSIGAELGSMKVTEQIDAMEVAGTNPFKYLVATRVVATTLMLPILTILGDAIALFGAYVGVNIRSVTSFHLFFSEIFNSLVYGDIVPAVVKTFFFGFAVGIIGCYKGYFSNKGTRGVGSSANSAVVLASVLIFIIDLLAVQITDLLGLN
ncbi:MlaE family ABC transporter permease [Mucilaginibacter gotjawali]|uniref:Phospholipid/cholesterol/gamma-HCH transport system permease protein n=2 Tax=Mucilaginibacter gotjawali TaxID=1550579 RepID=A0A839SDM5_9SPHI|nr:ABC transporter permease [Mucilaginibacter gotjawali]MBB3056355.1 phospholipid/cholesterol/gamma-HCH transport system permease protein [Mucilaginibacter gotjawali]BAU55060.1 putative phospholipid ABC transporter permease protein MlaE [Mucilaginibacter gotjawali]